MKQSSFPFSDNKNFWLGFLAVAFLMVWVLSDVLAPFVTGLAIAYMLNPLVTQISVRMPRAIASGLVLLVFTFILITLVIVVSPMIARQAIAFFNDLPHYIDQLQKAIEPYFSSIMYRLSPEDVAKIQEAAGEHIGSVLKGARSMVLGVWTGGMAVINIVTFLIITPIVAFYCMRDWTVLTKHIDDLLPRKSASTLRAIFNEFDTRLSGFVRGQMMVCLCLGTFYSLALTIAGLNFGLAIGSITGILSFIPYVGSTIGFVSSVGIALAQYDDYQMPVVIAGIFFLGQFIEGNFLTPQLVGSRIGLHAVWVIFALMAGGKLLGFTGMLLAVPVAALIGVIMRYGLMWYKQSAAYSGEKAESDTDKT